MFKQFLLPSTLVVALLILSATTAPVRRSSNDDCITATDKDYINTFVNVSRNLTSEIESPIYNMTIQDPTGYLSPVLNDLCDLLSFYDMLGAVNETNGDNLLQILTVIVLDACKWIVDTTDTASGEESCNSPDLLRKQCVAERANASGWLKDKFSDYKVEVVNYTRPEETCTE